MANIKFITLDKIHMTKKILTQTGTLYLIVFTSISLHAAPAPIITSTMDADMINKSPGIGYTISTAQRPFIGVDDQNTSLPYFSYRYKDFYIESLDIGYNITRQKGFSLDVLATPRFYERKDSFANNGELEGVSTTSETYLAGISSQFHMDYGVLTFQLLYDVIESNGIEAVAVASKTFDVTKTFKFTPSIGLSYQDAKLVNHFYGVESDETIIGRPAYDGEPSLNYNVTFNASWDVHEHIELLGQFKYEWLGDGITDSSIVDEDSLYFFTTGVVFRY
jgi:outer membrane scaffolding protein for murein synthesis (MipA/OmpV family)